MKLLAVLVAAGLAGCVVGPDFQRPAVPGSQRYAAGVPAELGGNETQVAQQHLLADAPVDAEWWRMFHSPQLDEIVQRALAGNRTLVAAGASLDEAQQLLAARSGTLLPQVSATGGVGRQKYGAQFLGSLAKPPPFSYFAIGARVSYALDYTGGAARGVEQQRALTEYQQRQLEAARLAVSGNAVLLSLQAASLRDQIATTELLLGRDRENLRLVEEARSAGSGSQLDVLTARSQLASDTTQLPPLRQQLDVAQHALAVLTGSAPADATLPVLSLDQITLPAELPLSVPSELAHRRPDILASEAQLHAATAAVGVATSNPLPAHHAERIDRAGGDHHRQRLREWQQRLEPRGWPGGTDLRWRHLARAAARQRGGIAHQRGELRADGAGSIRPGPPTHCRHWAMTWRHCRPKPRRNPPRAAPPISRARLTGKADGPAAGAGCRAALPAIEAGAGTRPRPSVTSTQHSCCWRSDRASRSKRYPVAQPQCERTTLAPRRGRRTRLAASAPTLASAAAFATAGNGVGWRSSAYSST